MTEPARQRSCLYCDDDATSIEHVISAGLGGRLRRTILCPRHNGVVNDRCDKPLTEQFQFLVHALGVDKDGRGEGQTVEMRTEDGRSYRVDADHVPHIKTGVLERDASGRPTKIALDDMEHGSKFLATMGLSPSDPTVVLEGKTEFPPPLTIPMRVGGEEGFRGVLKIAYEFSRGVQGATIVDAVADGSIRDAIVGGAVAVDVVRWLPFEMYEQFTTECYSHHVLIWDTADAVLAIVELFNACPFVVRLPGLKLGKAPILYAQGIKGEAPVIGGASSVPALNWDDVPLHAQAEMLPEVNRRLASIMEAMQFGDLLKIACQCAGETVIGADKEGTTRTLTDRAFELLRSRVPAVQPTDANLRDFVERMVTFITESRAQNGKGPG